LILPEPFSFKAATKEDLQAVWDNVRECDKNELSLLGDKGYEDFIDLPYCYCVSADNKPFLIFGANVTEGCIWFASYATPDVYKYIKSFTKYTTHFMDIVAIMEYPKRSLIQVLEHNKNTKRWLKSLGYHPTGSSYKYNDIRIEVWER